MDVVEAEILFRPMKRIALPNGDVLRAIKATDTGFAGFGETYFSYIHYQTIKAWKLHKRHTANFICPMGKVKLVIYKEHSRGNPVKGYPKEIILSDDPEQYHCVTIPPGIWYGFAGLGKPTNLIFSLLNGEHSLDEQLSADVDTFPYTWNVNHD